MVPGGVEEAGDGGEGSLCSSPHSHLLLELSTTPIILKYPYIPCRTLYSHPPLPLLPLKNQPTTKLILSPSHSTTTPA